MPFRIMTYLHTNQFKAVFNYGSTLVAQPQLHYMTDLIGLTIQPTSTTNPTLNLRGGGDLAWHTFIRDAATHAGLQCSPYLYMTTATLTSLITGGYLDQLTTNVSNLLTTYNMDGITLDIEAGTNTASMTALIDSLVAKIGGKWIDAIGFAYSAVNIAHVDEAKLRYVHVMTYDMGWVPNTGGYPHSTIAQTQAGMQMWVTAGWAKSKLIMGIPAYGKTLYDTDYSPYNMDSLTFAQILTQNANADLVDSAALTASAPTAGSGQVRTFWWGSHATTETKIAWAVSEGYAGAFMFAWGQDSLNDSKSILKAIYDEVNGGTPPAIPTIMGITGASKVMGVSNPTSVMGVS